MPLTPLLGAGLSELKVQRSVFVWLMLAVLAGALAAWAANRHLDRKEQQIERAAHVETVPRVVAAYDLAPGTVLEPALLAVRDVPRDWAVSDSYAPERVDALVGMVVSRDVAQGSLLLPPYLSSVASPELAQQLGAGERAVTLEVDDTMTLSGMLQPGDHVDVFVSFDRDTTPVTAPLLTDVMVLATGRRQLGTVNASTRDPQDAQDEDHVDNTEGTVTLRLCAIDAVRLTAARRTGTLTVLLRGRGDRGAAPTVMSGNLDQLLHLRVPHSRRPTPVSVLYAEDLDLTTPPCASSSASSDAAEQDR